ncbi:HNH endonuclease [Tunturiibacter psychrotolerans]|uniref:HNH endonuclease n=1 Tax=Tunturiibacter psychrotolerans TaxID=3069686 RepID=UPI003D1A66E0
MSQQNFSAAQREAIWLACQKKCPYTSRLLDVRSLHIDHIIPESLLDTPSQLEVLKSRLGLPADFDVHGYENLLPCDAGTNFQKGSSILDEGATRYFLSLASKNKPSVEKHLAEIANRNLASRAIILLQQAIEKGQLTPTEVTEILEKYTKHPEEIFTLLQGLQFADKDEVSAVAKTDIENLLDRPIKLGQNKVEDINGVSLTKDPSEQIYVRTCREYDAAIKDGFYARTTFDMKMEVFFRHQCGLLSVLRKATTAQKSFIAEPRVGIVDLKLLPFTMFPVLGEDTDGVTNSSSTYQQKVDDGSIVITQVSQNLLSVQEAGGGMSQQLIEVARADFNGDGIEDILLFEYYRVTDGTFGSGSIVILTRKSEEGLFEVVSNT